MNRMLAGAALAVAIIGSTAAFAAGTTGSSSSSTTPAAATTSSTPAPASTASTKPAPIDYAARCTSLADQWKTAEAANASNAKLGKAKASAAKGEKLCKSKKMSDEKKGSTAFEAALKLLGVTPT